MEKMPKELPGFYYDSEKNRYFPLKGPIPGSTSSSAAKPKHSLKSMPLPPSHAHEEDEDSSPDIFREKKKKKKKKERNGKRATIGSGLQTTYMLLQGRELNGSLIPSSKPTSSFLHQFLNFHAASHPQVWKFQGTEKIADAALDHLHLDILRPEGRTEVDALLAAGINGSLSLFEVRKDGQHFSRGANYTSDRVWPEHKGEDGNAPVHIWRPAGPSLLMSSSVSCVKLSGNQPSLGVDDGLSVQHALITTLGSERCGGSIYILNLVEPLDFLSTTPMVTMMRDVASVNGTIWTADCNANSSEAVIGTNMGAGLVNLESGAVSWVCRTKSDVLAQQLNQSGHVVICGLRNGAIVSVDIREKQEALHRRLITHRLSYSTSGKHGPSSSKQWFEIKGNIHPSSTIFMPSSISCLVSLQSYDQYFIASSMDGTVKLYDHRMSKRGSVQSYEGHVNSHTRLQLGVDQSERFLMAGGEDCNLRLWSIKSGRLLFEKNISDSVPMTVRWQRTERSVRTPDEDKCYEECQSGQSQSLGAWFGSREGLFYMSWP